MKRVLKDCEVGRMRIMVGPWKDKRTVDTTTVVAWRTLLFRDTELRIQLPAIFVLSLLTISHRTVKL